MKQINLLPLGIRQREAQQQLVSLAVVSGLLSLLLVGGGYFFLNDQADSLDHRIDVAQSRNSGRAEEIRRQQEVGDQGKDLGDRITKLNQLAKAEVNWSQVFGGVAATVNKDIRYSLLSLVPDSSGLGIKASGSAPSNASFAEFVEALKGAPAVNSVKVDSYGYTPSTGQVAFSLSYRLPVASLLYQSASTTK